MIRIISEEKINGDEVTDNDKKGPLDQMEMINKMYKEVNDNENNEKHQEHEIDTKITPSNF